MNGCMPHNALRTSGYNHCLRVPPMFPQVNRVRSGAKTYEYLRIVESYRDDHGRTTHRVVANLGRLDQLGGKLDALLLALARFSQRPLLSAEDVRLEQALPWGPILLARHLYDRLGLGRIIATAAPSARRQFDIAQTAFVLIANRLSDPRSEHGLARWLESYFVCDDAGERWLPQWLPEERITAEQRVRVEAGQLNTWYRTLDALVAAKSEIEHALYLKVRDLFHLDVDMVLYDVTSTYFARRSPTGELRRHGHSRDGKRRNVQVLLGVVIANGFPIAHHIFPGNTADKATVETVIADLEQRLGLRRVLIVGDRGMVSASNLELLNAPGRELRYLLGVPGRRCEESAGALEAATDEAWLAVDEGNRVQEVRLATQPGVRYFVVDSAERKAYEQELRLRAMERAKEHLAKVAAAVSAGRLKAPATIGARAARAVEQDHGKRYFSYDIPGPGQFAYWEDPAKLEAEARREGRYVLKTNDPEVTAEQAVPLYKQLSDVEWAYRDLKDIIQLRPIHHRTDERIEAHIFVATLALFVKRSLEHELTGAGVNLTPTEAFAAMHSMGIGVMDLGGERRHLVSSGGRDARRIVQALGIQRLGPPGVD